MIAMSTIILHIDSISKSYSRKIKTADGNDASEKTFVLRNLSLDIEAGSISALIGGNGSGKTTLFNVLNGLLRADSGKAVFNNGASTNLLGTPAYKIARLGVGRLFQDNHTFPELSVLENMMIAGLNHADESPGKSLVLVKSIRNKEKTLTKKALEVFFNLFGPDNDFTKKRDKKSGSLSYGQQRLLGLARLFMHDYTLLLLDEPTAGVNPELFDVIIESIKKLVKQNACTVLFTEHNMDVVNRLAENCAFLCEGMIKHYGPTNEVLEVEEVKKGFLGL